MSDSDRSQEGTPKPLYGSQFGRIDTKNSLNARATIGDDGRVEMHFGKLSRSVSKLMYPTLKAQMDHAARLDSIGEIVSVPPSIGDPEHPAPPMNVVIQIVGTRGDVQPFVALGKVLKERYGHRVRLATHETFKGFVENNGLEFFCIGGDPAELIAFMVKNPGLLPGIETLKNGDVSRKRHEMAVMFEGLWRSCIEPGDGLSKSEKSPLDERPFVADAIIANPVSFAHVHCAERLSVPLHLMFTMPWSPTHAFAHPLANVLASDNDDSTTNYLSYALMDLLTWQGLADVINRFRRNTLGLTALKTWSAPNMLAHLRIPFTYCWSPALIPKPRDWPENIICSGFYFLDLASDYTPDPILAKFLASGAPPVYIGFGSVVVEDPDGMTKLIFKAVKLSGQRALVSKGWGGIGGADLKVPDNVFMLGNVPHDWLFKYVSCVCHHGGAGTTATGIAAGRPTIIVPFFGDQPFWGGMIARAGAGPHPIPIKELTAERLAEAIKFCLVPDVGKKAAGMAEQIRSERGTLVGAQSFQKELDVDNMRCVLMPCRPAVWITKKGVRLSALAATVLAKEGLVKEDDLRLFKARSYNMDLSPPDPVTGGAAAIVGSMTAVFGGIVETPVAAYRAVKKVDTAEDLHQETAPTRDPSAASVDLDDRGSRKKSGQRGKFLDSNRGAGKAIVAYAKSPLDFSLGLAHGFHNAPKLYGEEVKDVEKIEDFKGGVKVAGKEFVRGFGLGVAGLVTQPYKGARDGGGTGFLKGIGRGVGGLILKPGAAMFGLPAYTAQGVYMQQRKMRYGLNIEQTVSAGRVAQGLTEYESTSNAEKAHIIRAWTDLYNQSRKFKDCTEESLSTFQSSMYQRLESGLMTPSHA
eukprot:Blabericola_migrator_1__13342@NODE_940_length_5959_cov_113_267312_g652_i0_p1_GENE_NODE_940_length_5959_cov_113_267312_g652_i0NODE_940_length_5959_cov_113_267312_g652_i0_p1_ORF_typecomplete_len864_score135_03Glyco_transf_28/PF03033_20/2_4e38UDPGT/PF00201_18/2_3e25ATG_C/PF09333_11/3_4e03ATG_C/PF09333_11/1_7e03ATG_C/PF09333_11/1e11Glyco_tran_28_C/PF04101_16/4e06VPS13_C/PF16909_5/0_0014_NODE_940_length_5959_cov_113_267312_g652_i08893480